MVRDINDAANCHHAQKAFHGDALKKLGHPPLTTGGNQVNLTRVLAPTRHLGVALDSVVMAAVAPVRAKLYASTNIVNHCMSSLVGGSYLVASLRLRRQIGSLYLGYEIAQ